MKIVISTNMGIITTRIGSLTTKSAPKDAQVTAGHVHVKPLLGIRKWPWPMAQKKRKNHRGVLQIVILPRQIWSKLQFCKGKSTCFLLKSSTSGKIPIFFLVSWVKAPSAKEPGFNLQGERPQVHILNPWLGKSPRNG